MAELNNSLIHFDSICLDVNENLSNSETHLLVNNGEIHETVPSKTEIAPECDLTFGEPLSLAENSNNSIKVLESTTEIVANTLDELLQHVDEHNKEDLTLNETLHISTSPSNCLELEMPEITNNLDVLPSDVKEDNTVKRNSDSGIHDSDNNIIEDTNTNMIDFMTGDLNFLPDDCGMITDFRNEENDVQFKDEDFHDAVQFFKDPSSFTILENAGSTNASADPLITRSSLYVNFDPLHAKFFSQQAKSNELHEITENDVEPEVCFDDAKSDAVPEVVNKHLVNVSPRESLGNILISFDSPLANKGSSSESVESCKQREPEKLYTEEEMQQALKVQELSVQETFLKKQHDLELTRSQQQQELEAKIQKQDHLCKAFQCLIMEITEVAGALSEKEKLLQEKLDTAEKENVKLKEDLKTSVEDLQSVESTFSDFHKRYEQCKSMLKVYTQNEDNFKQQIENLKVQLQEKEEMYKALQSRTEEMLDKANLEVATVKKAGDSQVAVLKAQLKKAELKISSLESDVKHVKIENGKLSTICDELMAKVSEG